MTFIKTKLQLELFRLTTPLYCGKLVNKIEYKKQQNLWIIKNTGKAGWDFNSLRVKVNFDTKTSDQGKMTDEEINA